MDLASASEFYFVYEPIVSPAGNVLGFEMLTRRTPTEARLCDAEHLFSMLDARHKIQIFSDQVDTVTENAAYFSEQNLRVSLNVDLDIAEFIARSSMISNKLKKLAFVRLEINEHFPELYQPRPQPLLTQLACCCPLWLDDFGSVNYPRRQPQLAEFEYIKLDKQYFWRNQNTEKLSSMIKQLNQISGGVIVEGIETLAHREGLINSGIVGMQGYLWPSRVQCNPQNAFR